MAYKNYPHDSLSDEAIKELTEDCETMSLDFDDPAMPDLRIETFVQGPGDFERDMFRIVFSNPDYRVSVAAHHSEFEDRQYGQIRAILRAKLANKEQYRRKPQRERLEMK